MIRSLRQAKADLSEHQAKFYEAIAGALREFIAEYAIKRKDLSVRSERSIIHDLMVKHIKREFTGIPGIATYFKHNLFLLGVGGSYTIKLKKLNRRLRTSNATTQLVLDFLRQQLEIPGLEGPTCLHLGYKLHPVELTKSEIYITCPNGRRLAWDWLLDSGAAATRVPVVPFAPKLPTARPRRTDKARENAATEEPKSHRD